jgi:uncharacterized MAPEG superfamily protein
MKLTPELYALVLVAFATALMWIPYLVARIGLRGLMPVMGNPDPSQAPDPAWVDRARRAHVNAIENLAVFAPLVLVAHALGLTGGTIASACAVYFWARVVHAAAYTFAVPWARTLAFTVGFGAQVAIGWVLLAH